jgi:catechol 2,3-dioxygenase-like lactoylglutathione lyase family enzyme
MAFSLDHVVIAVSDLEQAMQDYRDLGFTVMFGGKHTHSPTHNALIYFKSGAYIELLARLEGNPQAGGVDFSPLVDSGEGLTGYCLGSDDLDADLAAMRLRGIPAEPSIDGGRKRADGAQLIWKTGRVGESFAPFFIQDVTPRELRVPTDPALTTHANGVTELVGVEVITPLNEEVIQRYQNMLGIAPDELALTESVRTFTLSSGHLVLTSPEALVQSAPDAISALDEIEESTKITSHTFRAYMQQTFESRRAQFERNRSQETLNAVQVLMESVPNIENLQESAFALEKTHGVRFIQAGLSVDSDEDEDDVEDTEDDI